MSTCTFFLWDALDFVITIVLLSCEMEVYFVEVSCFDFPRYLPIFFLTGISGTAYSQAEEEGIGAFSALRNVGKSSKDGILGTAAAPIHMVTAEGGHFKEQLWRTVRALGMAFLLISGAGALIEDRGIGKGTVIYIRLY